MEKSILQKRRLSVRLGSGSNAKLYYVEVINVPIVNLTDMTEVYGIDIRTSHEKVI